MSLRIIKNFNETNYTLMRRHALNMLKNALNESQKKLDKNEDKHLVMVIDKAISNLKDHFCEYKNYPGDSKEFPFVIECEEDDKKSHKRKYLSKKCKDENESICTKKVRLENAEKGVKVSKKCRNPTNVTKILRQDLPPVPKIHDSLFAEMATCRPLHKKSWETLEFLGDRVLMSCLFKISEPKYLQKHCADTIGLGVRNIATNKILAAYSITLGIHKFNGMESSKIKKVHADALEAYIGTYYLTSGELALCRYLDKLMTPLLDLIINGIASGNKILNDSYKIASEYFAMAWIRDGNRLT
ncbi:7540_t:CDS:2 [Gigaspora margarita]|uniref:7540_t:CDS:1 n=1 Tax=Gigaspora margarita TaxID=4874 RepID=A0ABN7V6G3_GIGMA|nr:7540_t:CDS:2 [Gigaspora margarita]